MNNPVLECVWAAISVAILGQVFSPFIINKKKPKHEEKVSELGCPTPHDPLCSFINSSMLLVFSFWTFMFSMFS
ncbi:hypothetical protein HanOQP8_Chr00c004g0684281 [Helianthus annuus]|nr:hypothetical protein HanOQP8_Chr00c004g0684281 [Helianthus annuus]